MGFEFPAGVCFFSVSLLPLTPTPSPLVLSYVRYPSTTIWVGLIDALLHLSAHV